MKKLFYKIYRIVDRESYIENLEARCQSANFAPFDIVMSKTSFEWNDRTIEIAENWLSGKRGQQLFTS